MSRLLLAIRTRLVVAAREEGMSTAEYCIGTLAAVALAAVLYKVLSGGWAEDLVKAVISHAFGFFHL